MGIVDYGIGNLGSVANMLKRIRAAPTLIRRAEDFNAVSHLILPGVGHFAACMSALKGSGLIEPLKEQVFQHRKPTLGICVGYQMMTKGSEEGDSEGLGWFAAKTLRFRFSDRCLKVPHMGWNHVHVNETQRSNPLVHGLNQDSRYYFVHSYYVQPEDRSDFLLAADYGNPFAAALSRDNLYGVQFHVEKSHRHGMMLLKNFVDVRGEYDQ